MLQWMLEGLARHRGSVFGSTGMGCQPGQKMFDSLLWCELKRLDRRLHLVECESRRIGIYIFEHLPGDGTGSPYPGIR